MNEGKRKKVERKKSPFGKKVLNIEREVKFAVFSPFNLLLSSFGSFSFPDFLIIMTPGVFFSVISLTQVTVIKGPLPSLSLANHLRVNNSLMTVNFFKFRSIATH